MARATRIYIVRHNDWMPIVAAFTVKHEFVSYIKKMKEIGFHDTRKWTYWSYLDSPEAGYSNGERNLTEEIKEIIK